MSKLFCTLILNPALLSFLGLSHLAALDKQTCRSSVMMLIPLWPILGYPKASVSSVMMADQPYSTSAGVGYYNPRPQYD